MNTYITGPTIKNLRESKGITQSDLAEKIGVSSQAISKWETSKGLPDITLIEPLSKALGVSVMELMSGDTVINRNVSCNLLRSKFYVCPVCGNIIHSSGEAVISCCGISLPPLEAEEVDENHEICIEKVEDENFVTVNHPMEKSHYISFIAYVTGDRMNLVKLYPEGNAETRFQLRGSGFIYIYCNKHGLMKQRINRK
ncbi:MAG: helix-turn-helix domain-containing protein [Firmicutes bacterium]|nr:helix-turn-helix domain-containing protein [Bacillota bacterium]